MHHLADSSQTQLCTACLEISPASSGFTTGPAKHNIELISGRVCALTAQMNLLAATEGKKKKKAKLVFDYSQCLSLLYSRLLKLQLQHEVN